MAEEQPGLGLTDQNAPKTTMPVQPVSETSQPDPEPRPARRMTDAELAAFFGGRLRTENDVRAPESDDGEESEPEVHSGGPDEERADKLLDGPPTDFMDNTFDDGIVSNRVHKTNILLKDKIWRNRNTLAAHLGFDTSAALAEFLRTDPINVQLMKDFDEYRRANPQSGKNRTSYHVARNTIRRHERISRREFSRIDKAAMLGWTHATFHAYMLWRLTEEHVTIMTGVLHRFEWVWHTSDMIHQRMWQLLCRLKADRRSRTRNGTNRKQSKTAA